LGLERSVVLLHPRKDSSSSREMAATAERSQQRRRDGSLGGEIAATAERWQLRQACGEDQSGNSDQMTRFKDSELISRVI